MVGCQLRVLVGYFPHEKLKAELELSDSEGILEPTTPLSLSERDEEDEDVESKRSRLIQESQIRVEAAEKSKHKIRRLEQEVLELRKPSIAKLWQAFVAREKQAKAATYGFLDKVVGRDPPHAEVLVIQSGPGDRKAKKIRKYLKEGKQILKYDDIVFTK
ncbi:unnamed protein product [Lactuca saligna]|uniref:Uncharacterized protein n=1 Tax=Lactuca saligna TaxID=75948 RepID=A0AA35YNC2_LACSI|nr:unnamed protein product [Lactuca saligna]